MTALQKSVLRASEIRTRLSELGGEAELSDEQRAELDKAARRVWRRRASRPGALDLRR